VEIAWFLTIAVGTAGRIASRRPCQGRERAGQRARKSATEAILGGLMVKETA